MRCDSTNDVGALNHHLTRVRNTDYYSYPLLFAHFSLMDIDDLFASEEETAPSSPARADAKRKAPSQAPRPVAASSSVNSKLLNDVEIEPAADQQMPGADATGALFGALAPEHYAAAQEAAAAQAAQVGGVALGATRIAAMANHYVGVVERETLGTRSAHLADTPYTTPTAGAAFGRAFFMAALTEQPHLSRSIVEDTDALRALQSKAQFVRRSHIEAMTRTPRASEPQCASGDLCAGRALCDAQGTSIGGEPLVAFMTESEAAQYRIDRSAVAQALDKRQCILCMTRAANRLLVQLRADNVAFNSHRLLLMPYCVKVDVQGEYPVGATVGAGENTFEGLLYNVPRFSLLDWAAIERPGGEDFTQYRNVAVPEYPVPREHIERFTRQGFSAAS